MAGESPQMSRRTSELSPRLVFILGAGASVHAGVPVAANFLERSFQLLDARDESGNPVLPPGDPRARDIYEVMRAQREVLAASAFGPAVHINVESLFSAIEVLRLVEDQTHDPVNGGIDFKDLRRSMAFLIAETVSRYQTFHFDASRKLLMDPMVALLRGLNELVSEGRLRLGQIVFITFNYDLVLEVALEACEIRFHRANASGANFHPGADGVTVVKLHGSIDELRCLNGMCDGQVVPELSETPLSRLRETHTTNEVKTKRFDWWKALHGKTCPKCRVGMQPHIVPPTWSKLGHYDSMFRVWHRAASALADAEVIASIGYSIPVEDRQFPMFWQLARRHRDALKGVAVINPDDSAYDRHKDVFRGVTESRYVRIEGANPFSPPVNGFNIITSQNLVNWVRGRFAR